MKDIYAKFHCASRSHTQFSWSSLDLSALAINVSLPSFRKKLPTCVVVLGSARLAVQFQELISYKLLIPQSNILLIGVFDFLVSSLHYMTGYPYCLGREGSWNQELNWEGFSFSQPSLEGPGAGFQFIFEGDGEKKKASWYNAQDSQEPFNFGGETLPLSNSA